MFSITSISESRDIPSSHSRYASGDIWRYAVLALIAAGSLFWILQLAPIPQNSAYHDFADHRDLAGIPNALDVISNLPFLVVGVLGLRLCRRSSTGLRHSAWALMFAALGLVSLGSGYYHWSPDNDRLVWDRLPMTVGFMSLFSALLGEYVHARLGRLLLTPALALGLASIGLWVWSGDLRLYFWVQLLPLLSIPVLMLLFHGRHSHQWMLLLAFGWYALAKLAEAQDPAIFSATWGLISGHSVKHLLAAAGCYSLVLMLRHRRPLRPPASRPEADSADATPL